MTAQTQAIQSPMRYHHFARLLSHKIFNCARLPHRPDESTWTPNASLQSNDSRRSRRIASGPNSTVGGSVLRIINGWMSGVVTTFGSWRELSDAVAR